MKSLLFSIGLLISISSYAQTCIRITGLVENTSDSSAYDLIGKRIFSNQHSIWDDSIQVEFNSTRLTFFDTKDELLKYYKCSYTFPHLPRPLNGHIWRAEFDHISGIGNYIENVYLKLENGEEVDYTTVNGYFYTFDFCGDWECKENILLQEWLFNSNKIITLTSEIWDNEFIPAEFETVTEQVLKKAASTKIVALPPQWDTIPEIYSSEICDCENVVAIYDTQLVDVTIQEASTEIIPIASVFESVTEQVLVKQASTKYQDVQPDSSVIDTGQVITEIIPVYDSWVLTGVDSTCTDKNPLVCIEWDLIPHGGISDTSDVSLIEVYCPDGSTQSGNNCLKIVEIPAEYSTRIYEKLVMPATTTVIEVPPTHEVYQSVSITNKEEIPDSCIHVIVDTIVTYKLSAPATTNVIEIPAVYETRNIEVLVTPASVEMINYIPAQTKEIAGKSVFRNAEQVYWPVICNIFLSQKKLNEIKSKLWENGYDPGPADKPYNYQFHLALTKFQKDEGLSTIGKITRSTLLSLGLHF